jgi:hypothetical protein
MDDKVIEIMARWLQKWWDDDGEDWSVYSLDAQAAVMALAEAGYEIIKRDDTMATVPREPTEAMHCDEFGTVTDVSELVVK